MRYIFAPGFGASKRSFHYYEQVFQNKFVKLDFSECISLEDHFRVIDQAVKSAIDDGEDFVLIGHSLGTSIISHYVLSREVPNLKGMVLIGGGKRFYPAEGMNFLMNLPNFMIFLMLVGMALVSPLMFILMGWQGMMERLEAIKLSREMGIQKIKDVYHETIVKVINPPPLKILEIPVLLLTLPKDVLFPSEGITDLRVNFPRLELHVIPANRYHFTHKYDVYVAGVIKAWIEKTYKLSLGTLSSDIKQALENPRMVFEATKDFQITRKQAFIFLSPILVLWYFYGAFISRLTIELLRYLQPTDSWDTKTIIIVFAYVFVPLYIIFDAMFYPRARIKYKHVSEIKVRLPKVSIILPTRNEEKNIAFVLSTLLSLNYPDYEIIIMDGSTTTKTLEIARKYVEKNNPRNIPVFFKMEPPLPKGWIGKSWSCYNAVKFATGELILFTDADTRHTPDSLLNAVMLMKEKQLDAMSIVGKFVMKTIPEKAIMPLIHVIMFSVLGGRLMNHKKWPLTIGIGQYFLIKKDFYEKIGTHAAFKSTISEDLAMAKRSKKLGRFAVFKGTDFYHVRMYSNLNEILTGFTKNVYDGLGQNILIAIGAALAVMVWFGLPVVGLPVMIAVFGLVSIETAWYALTMLFLMSIVIPSLIDNDVDFKAMFLFPMGAIIFLAIIIRSIYLGATNKPIVWRDRVYMFKMQ